MATPRKSDKAYPGYLADQNRKPLFSKGKGMQPFTPSTREEELLSKTVHPEDFEAAKKSLSDDLQTAEDKINTLEVRFNELCNMLSVQLANSSFKLLEIRNAKK